MLKFLYLLIIATVISSSITFGHALSQETGNQVFFMKANATAKIYTQFTFRMYDSGSMTLHSGAFSYPDGLPVNSITVVVEPTSFTVNRQNVNVTYTITAKNTINGTYGISNGLCGGFYALVVGLNESEVNPKTYYNFYNRSYSCPAYTVFPQNVKVLGYSGLVAKTFSENSSVWGTPSQPLTTVPESPLNQNNSSESSPLKQFKSGVTMINITCGHDLVLIIKTEDGSPACVKGDTANILTERGWGYRAEWSMTHIEKIQNKTSQIQTQQEQTTSMSCDTPFGNGMLYMPKNSVGKICVTTNISDPVPPQLGISDAMGNPNPKIVISKYPTIIHQGTNSIMVYTITTGNYSGINDLTFICSELPFAVGNDNFSIADLRNVPSFGGMFVGAHSCPPSTYEYSLSGVSGIDFKIIH